MSYYYIVSYNNFACGLIRRFRLWQTVVSPHNNWHILIQDTERLHPYDVLSHTEWRHTALQPSNHENGLNDEITTEKQVVSNIFLFFL